MKQLKKTRACKVSISSSAFRRFLTLKMGAAGVVSESESFGSVVEGVMAVVVVKDASSATGTEVGGVTTGAVGFVGGVGCVGSVGFRLDMVELLI